VYKLSPQEKSALKNYIGVKSQSGEYEKALRKKAEKYCKIFKHIPGIEWIFLCNSVAMNTADKNSDIDLFIITRKNRLWTARISMTLLWMILRVRKTNKRHAWKFCLSFFIDMRTLDFDTISIQRDIYLSYWIETLIPLINRNNIYERFIAINSWEHWEIYTFAETVNTGKIWVISQIWDNIEYIFKKIFLPRTLKKYEALWKPEWVIIDDHMLKFHNKDRRRSIRDEVLKKI